MAASSRRLDPQRAIARDLPHPRHKHTVPVARDLEVLAGEDPTTRHRRMSSGVHEGCTSLTRPAVDSHCADANLCAFAGTCTTEEDLAQRRFLPYKQEVACSSQAPPTGRKAW
jgi:hypothetical protein